MSTLEATKVATKLSRIGNSYGLRLPKAVLEQSGLANDAAVTIRVEAPGRIVIEAALERPTLEYLLEGYDADKHSRDSMDFLPVGRELF